MGRLLARLGITAGLLISLTALTPTAAYATPSCVAVTYDLYVEGFCGSGDGEFRAVAVCEYVTKTPAGHYHWSRNEYGPWVAMDAVSTAYCRPGGGTLNGFILTR